MHPRALGLVGRIDVVGGVVRGQDSRKIFDLATMSWSRGPDLPTKRHGLASAVVDGRWYLIGGGRSAMLSVSDIVEVFTPDSRSR
ncbi:MAG: hypothetical protein M3Q66_09405 [Chloroflexota bacterium]|nr:hypothetical protein [Chloroflexota bacterium]